MMLMNSETIVFDENTDFQWNMQHEFTSQCRCSTEIIKTLERSCDKPRFANLEREITRERSGVRCIFKSNTFLVDFRLFDLRNGI